MLLNASEVGHAFGCRAAEEANVTTLEAAILGLLALMISFTFSTGLTRFDELAGDGGVADLRQVLYMPALVAIRFKAAMKGKYQAFIAAGHPLEVAYTAIMLKLAIIAIAFPWRMLDS